MIQLELKALRNRIGWTLDEAARIIGITSGEGYRRKELPKNHPRHAAITGIELALLADAAGIPFDEAFPSYSPTEGEQALARHLATAA
ncbi:MAG TPA: hypothetical protein VFI96_04310 [Longimicrobiaceae bacterium]|nr:hypothetical protein [Longimicrobiaceae bacterium]